ncbi:hypothetical protein [Streptomyces sp. GC420]|nr:hypothetical protein [Streptomyces sp. GC420]
MPAFPAPAHEPPYRAVVLTSRPTGGDGAGAEGSHASTTDAL